MEHERPSKLRQFWNKLCGRHPYENKKGEIITRHGKTYIPRNIVVTSQGAVHWTNAGAFLAQPRARELLQQMKPLETAERGDRIHLDKETGRFYLRSAFEKAASNARPLGEIDVEVESDLFGYISEIVGCNKLLADLKPR